MDPLTIGVNALYLLPGQVGGTEIYLRSLLGALCAIDQENRYVVFINRETGDDLVPRAPNFGVAAQPVRAAFRPARILWEQTGLVVSAAMNQVDVLLNPGFTAPLACRCPSVTVFHDLQHKRHPEYFRWFDLPFWRVFLWASAHRSTALITPSQATASDLLKWYAVRPEKVHVISHGVDPNMYDVETRRPTRISRKYLLAVSTLHPHKNLDRLIRAFATLRRSGSEIDLVIIGLNGFVAASLRELVVTLHLEDSVRLTGWIPREEVYDYFATAFAFIHPSLFEGFGLPVLEALAAGVPVACSRIEPLTDIAGDGCLYFDPTSETEMADAIQRLTSDDSLRHELVTRGRRIAEKYSWHVSAAATLAVLRQAAALSLLGRPTW